MMMGKDVVSIIGAGKAGSVISKKLSLCGYKFNSVISKKKSSAKILASLIKCPSYSDDLKDIPEDTKLIILAVPDSEIEYAAVNISRLNLKFNSLSIFHLSGSVPVKALHSLERKGATVFSVHPFQTIASRKYDKNILDSITYGIDGSEIGIKQARKIVKAMGGKSLIIPSAKKQLYHISGVFASNYLLALMSITEDILSEFEHDKKSRRKMLSVITGRSLNNYFSGDFQNKITGPIARGDYKTILNHINCLKKYDKDLLNLYKGFGTVIQKRMTAKNSKSQREIKNLLK